METLIISLIGFTIGMAITAIIFRCRTVGSLRVDNSDPNENPYIFLELERDPIKSIYTKKYVVLKVKIKDYIPRK